MIPAIYDHFIANNNIGTMSCGDDIEYDNGGEGCLLAKGTCDEYVQPSDFDCAIHTTDMPTIGLPHSIATDSPTTEHTDDPTKAPSNQPTKKPTMKSPTPRPTEKPSSYPPTKSPIRLPTEH